jgi:copper transport protein
MGSGKQTGHLRLRRPPLRRLERSSISRLLRACARRGLSVLAVSVVALSCTAAASAHAYLVHTNPAGGAVLKASPSRVTLVFEQGVATSAGALGVYDSAGKHVDTGVVSRPAGDAVAVDIERSLPRGTYTVAWRVTSADTHVVHGAFTFSVGAPGNAGGIAARLFASEQIPRSVTVPFAVLRFLNFLLILICAGGALALTFVAAGAAAAVQRRLAMLLAASAASLAVLAAAGLPFEGAEATGSGLSGGFSAAAIADVRQLRFGEVWLTRAWIAVALALLALSLEHWPVRWRLVRLLLAVGLGAGLVVTTTTAAHAGVDGWPAFAVDVAHAAAAAAWTGGLAFLLIAVVATAKGERWPFAAHAVPRFSTLALISVTVLLIAGVTNAYMEVRVWRGLWQTTYGQLVLVKAALVLPLLGLAAFNDRVSVPRLRAGIASALEQRRFLRAVGAELALLCVVVGVTAVLVSEPPAKDSLPEPKASTASTQVGLYRGTVTVAPAKVGPNQINLVFIGPNGKPPTARHMATRSAGSCSPGSCRRTSSSIFRSLSPFLRARRGRC